MTQNSEHYRNIKDVRFSRSPLADDLKKYLRINNNFSQVLSPVYGGGTSQSEFELLTGVKALAKIKSIEFNVLGGNPSFSFINQLKENGYFTIATIASNSGYYNSRQAYKSLGFSNVTFMEESMDYRVKKDDKHIFDGDAFDYNFNKIKNHLENKKDTPLVSYMLGMYGHLPYERNKKLRPDIIIAQHKNKKVQRISNQFYYRTKALAKYINDIIKIDPTSIIYITSDHLPPLLNNSIKYKINKKINISLLLVGGKQRDVSGMHYYEIPWLLWDILCEKTNYRKVDKIKMERLYYHVLGESIKRTEQ